LKTTQNPAQSLSTLFSFRSLGFFWTEEMRVIFARSGSNEEKIGKKLRGGYGKKISCTHGRRERNDHHTKDQCLKKREASMSSVEKPAR